ncbi:hypothetical protein D915_004614 [Fasciola hepatica]|uniref:Uncharacterized protein n=1 Tax=Fasciola hepatica TaxID=6192 RepID=A0A4E0R7F7_FASHE|nr:hypothetical protein D915_004614 [Fasciola hepatica]
MRFLLALFLIGLVFIAAEGLSSKTTEPMGTTTKKPTTKVHHGATWSEQKYGGVDQPYPHKHQHWNKN